MCIRWPSPNTVSPLLKLTKCSDWLGDVMVPIPPEELHSLFDLQMPGSGDALVWSDGDGKPLLALRSWRIESSQFGAESDALRGSDVIVRPDVFKKLQGHHGCPLREFHHITRQRIPPR